MDLKRRNEGIGFTNPLSLSGDKLIKKWEGRYIKFMTPDLAKVIQSDFKTAMKLPLSSDLFTRVFLSQNVDTDTLEDIVLGIADRTFIDFIFTDPYGLAELFKTYIEADLQDTDFDESVIRRGCTLNEEAIANGKRGDKVYERLKHYEEDVIDKIENESERLEVLKAFRLVENELLNYVFPF